MLRSFWQSVKDTIYDIVGDVFRTQAEIDAEIEDMFGDYELNLVYDPGDIDPAFNFRASHIFLSPSDALAWIDKAGIPSEYVQVLAWDEGTTNGDYEYYIFVKDGS